MTIEVALVISGVSLAFGLYSGIANMKRNSKTDTNAYVWTRTSLSEE